MRNVKRVTGIFLIIFFIMGPIYAQEERPDVDDLVKKMKRQMNLTEEQTDSVKAIFENDMVKSQELMYRLESQGITDKTIMQTLMDELTEDKNQKLAKILTKDQIAKWKTYLNLQGILTRNSNIDDPGQPHKYGGY